MSDNNFVAVADLSVNTGSGRWTSDVTYNIMSVICLGCIIFLYILIYKHQQNQKKWK